MKLIPLASFAALCAGFALAPTHARAAETADQAQIKADIHQIVTDLKTDESQFVQSAESWEKAHHGSTAQISGGAPVPEPASWVLMGTLVLGAAAFAAREKKRLRV